jgi:hypothetical protein
MVRTSGPIPQAFGGVVTPGNYVLTGVTLYNATLPNDLSTALGATHTAMLTVSCDQYNEIFESETTSNGSEIVTSCGRLIPTERPLGSIVQSNDPSTDGTPYTATADTLELIDVGAFRSPPYVLGEFALVEQFTLVGSAPSPGPPDASTPPPSGRDSRCPATAPANGASCDPTFGPLECEYGGDAQGRCTTLAACALTPPADAFAYVVTPSTYCVAANEPSCPVSLEAAMALPSFGVPFDGGLSPRCNPDGGLEPTVACDYPGGACSCVFSNAAATACYCLTGADVTQGNSRCPMQRPLAGDGCTVEGAWCAYDPPCLGVSLGPSMMCADGHWIQFQELLSCPIIIICP